MTPGSLSGYTYYPPVKAGGGSGSGNASGRVETLQKCYVAIKSPDVSFTLQAAEFYGLENIRLYYKAAGGNGGTGTNGGGGGSTAIFLNGNATVIAPGGNGGQDAPVTKGDFQVAPGDSVRIVTGAVAARAGRVFQAAVGGRLARRWSWLQLCPWPRRQCDARCRRRRGKSWHFRQRTQRRGQHLSGWEQRTHW